MDRINLGDLSDGKNRQLPDTFAPHRLPSTGRVFAKRFSPLESDSQKSVDNSITVHTRATVFNGDRLLGLIDCYGDVLRVCIPCVSHDLGKNRRNVAVEVDA